MEDNYLVDRETLGGFVDELIKQKPLAVNNPEELNQLRESAIKSLDDRIATAVFGQFTEEQNDAYHQLLNRTEATEEDFQKFFDENGINVEKTIADTAEAFGTEFLGGQNV